MRWKLAIFILAVSVFVAVQFYDDFDSESVVGKRVIVTGASTGIGEQMAYHYAKLGAKLFIVARSEERLKKVVEKCKEIGQRDKDYYNYMIADMADVNIYMKVITNAVEILGGLDYLVLNHVFSPPLSDWLNMTDNLSVLQEVHNVNFRAYVHLATHAMPHLTVSSGSVIVVSSMAGRFGFPYVAAYASSKFALNGFFSSLRQELEISSTPVSITICTIGFIDTESAVTAMAKYLGEEVLNFVVPKRADDCALAIVKGGAMRLRDVYFPHYETKIMTLLHPWFPVTVECISKFIMTPKSGV